MSVDDIVEELSDLQDQLDALRTTQLTIAREALMDAAAKSRMEELVDLPKLVEELLHGVPFHVFEAHQEASEGTFAREFADLVNELHRQGPPVLEESFVDEGVRMRNFDSDEEASRPKSCLTIPIAELEGFPPRKPKLKPEATTKVNSKARSLSSDRDAPESLPPAKQGSSLRSPLPGSPKKKSKPRSSHAASTTSASPTPRKNEKSNGFPIRSPALPPIVRAPHKFARPTKAAPRILELRYSHISASSSSSLTNVHDQSKQHFPRSCAPHRFARPTEAAPCIPELL
jgi:hypothetical protein